MAENLTTEMPPQAVGPEIWAQVFVRKARREPGFPLDEAEVTEWLGALMTSAYVKGLRDGASL